MSATNELAEAYKVAFPITVTAGSFMGLPFQQWVYILTALYTLFQIIRLLPKMYGCVRCFMRNRTCNRSCKRT